jgi:uncharacterized membrane protein
MRVESINPKPRTAVMPNAPAGHGRLLWLDLARTLALLAMIVFHFTRDLELFGLLPSGTTATGGWAVFARAIAGSFIFLSGASLVLAHASGFRRARWARRFAVLSGAALLVSITTYAAFPDRYISFGILHCIAACSVVGVAFLRAPGWLLFALAISILAISLVWGSGVFASPWLAWTGLALTNRPSLDFLPLIPWLSAFLAGMAAAKSLPVAQWDVPVRARGLSSRLAWPGRHSLLVYLVHQPVLLAILWTGIWLCGLLPVSWAPT